MASESKRKSIKQSTITFTLPLSCQICLGKVKQPVLCPNHHVFCQLCMDIWLEKNRQCPTCRVDINDNNPVKNIIGGQLEDEEVKKQSSAELRRARFELLYKEYEDQFDQMRKESIILRTENNILLAQLQDAEDKNDEQSKADKNAKGASCNKNEPNLLMLTKNLQEAQTLYVGIKEEMTQLKQENSKLKDENVNLTRENENLRLEIAQRSPKKFGRYTVATLETKLSEYEKEIRQLKRALERSDEYVEDLEKQIEKLSESRHEQKTKALFPRELPHSENNGRAHVSGKERLTGESEDRKLLRPSGQKNEASESEERESARRILFSLCAEGEDKSVQMSESGSSKVGLESGNDNGEDTEHVKYPESIMKHGGAGETSHRQFDINGHNINGKMPKIKRVQFNVPKSTNSSISFELEMPSPYGNGEQQKPEGKVNKTEGNHIHNGGDEVDGAPPLNDFDTHAVSLLKKANVSSYNNIHNGHIPERKLASSEDLISNHKAAKKTSSRPFYEDSNDSSRLSLPDFDSPPKGITSDSDGLSDSPRKPGRSNRDTSLELDDTDDKMNEKLSHNKIELDISMTPEMSDCLRLLNQAERKLEMPPANIYSDRGMNLPSSVKSKPASSNHNPSSRAPPLPYNSSFKPHSFSSSESMKGWEQEFFRGLQTNPYKPYKFNNNPSSLTSITSENNKDLHGKSVRNGLPPSLHDDFSSLKKSQPIPHSSLTNTNASALPSHLPNQEPLSAAPPSDSKLPYNAISNPYGGGGLYSNQNSNYLASHFDKRQPFTGSVPISFSSSDHAHSAGGPSSNQNPLDRRIAGSLRAPTPPPGSATSSTNLFSISKNPLNYLLSSSSSSKDLHNGLYSSSHSVNPSSGTNHASFRNPLPPSLNNSSLEWPDSPIKSIGSSDPNDIPSNYGSNDTLPQPPSHRDRNRFTSLTGPSSPRNPHRGSSQDFVFTSANSSFSSDANNSSFLPEPKKRLFNLDDDLDLPTSKTAKK